MRINIWVLIPLFCYSLKINAQNYDLDSLIKLTKSPLEASSESIKSNSDFAFSLNDNYPELATKLAQKSFDTAKKIGDKSNMARALTVIGVIDWRKGSLDQSLIRFFEVMQIAEEINDSSRLGTVYINLANIYDDLYVFRNDQEAKSTSMKYGLKAYDIYKNLNDKVKLSVVTNNLGTMYSQRNKFDSALHFLNRALEIKMVLGDTVKISSTINNIGLVYGRQEKLEEALDYYNQAINLSNSVNDYRGLVFAQLNKGNILTKKKRFNEAHAAYQKGLDHANFLKSDKWISGMFGQLFALEYTRGNLEKALEYQELYYKAKEKIIESSQGLKIKNIEANHNLKNKEIELLNVSNELELAQEKEKNQSIIRKTLIGGILLLIIFGYIQFRNQRQKLEREKQYQIARRGLTQLELENAKLKSKELEKELDHKNRELTSYTMNFIQKNQMLEDLKGMTNEIINTSQSENISKPLQRLKNVINQNQTQQKDWDDFRLFFENVHPNFFSNLKNKFPELTPSDLKLSALVRLNMNLKETANVFGVEPSSIKTARYRLKKKLDLGQDEDLQGFLMTIES